MRRPINKIESRAVPASVLYFDKLSQVGMLLMPDGQNIPFHASCIVEHIGADEPTYEEYLEYQNNFTVRDGEQVHAIVYHNGCTIEKLYRQGYIAPEIY